MADELRQTPGPYGPVRVRREELIRPADRRRDFKTREAQRRLHEKERPRWALIGYGVFLVAVLLIFGVTYTTYAFSRYRDEILPGVHVQQLPLTGLTESQATKLLENAVSPIYHHPVRLEYGSNAWEPKAVQIGYQLDVAGTVKQALQVGRVETFAVQLFDRLPIHPDHSVTLLYSIRDSDLRSYIQQVIRSGKLNKPPQNARLAINSAANVALVPSQPGRAVDIPRTMESVHAALGSLTTQNEAIAVNFLPPSISDAYARSIQQRVETFLANSPVIGIGKRVFVTNRRDIAPMLKFQDHVTRQKAEIQMLVARDVVASYVAGLARTVDRVAQNAKLDYAGGKVRVITPRKTGRTLNQADAVTKLLSVVTGLKSNARLRFKIATTQPPIDVANPASLGIDTLLGIGETSFKHAASGRLDAISTIAARFDNVLLPPGQDISFNTLAGSGWSDNSYLEQEREIKGRLVPGRGGAMQQVATTFFRALFQAGLQVEERHAHVHRFAWYEPPVGLDAVVSPQSNLDLRFRNNSGKYLFLKVRVEPVRKELYIYVYGPQLGWKVSVDPLGKISKLYPHGTDVVKQDPSMTPGQVRQTAWAHDGADTVVERTITYKNGSVRTDKILSHYEPWKAILIVGAQPKPTATPTGKATATTTPTAQPTGTPQPTVTPTFNH